MALLSLVGVDLRFGDIVALDDVSLEVEEGQIAGLIGPNGAGKTTVEVVLRQLADETDVTLALIGAENARDLDSTWIAAS